MSSSKFKQIHHYKKPTEPTLHGLFCVLQILGNG